MTQFPRGAAIGRRGFTLVELLVTIAVIGILASMILGTLGAVQRATRVAATRATIIKLDQIIMERYESYRTRRVAMDPSNTPKGLAQSAGYRLQAIWELMRYEMPQNWYEVEDADPSSPPAFLETQPALARAYYTRFLRQKAAVSDVSIIHDYGSAECLYMIVTMGTPEGRTAFLDREVGDVDGDGLKEFVDGWGNPIQFFRWPVGFNDSAVQPNIIPPDSLVGDGTNWQAWDTTPYDQARTAAAKQDHDPFDVLGVLDPVNSPAWRTVPLIVSGGPDGILDLRGYAADDDTSAPTPRAMQKYPFRDGGYKYYTGIPDDQPVSAPTVGVGVPANGRLDHYDNIHNHRLEE